jgi:hypothetical protein
MPRKNELDHAGDGRRRDLRSRMRGRTARRAMMLGGTAALAVAAATPALASITTPSHPHVRDYHGPAVEIVAITPSPGDFAGAGGVFNVDLAAVARDAAGNSDLSAAHGYKPGIANPAPGIGNPDASAPGLVVLLSTTPKKKGGPDANLAGVFQLTDVAKSHGAAELFADWEVGKAGLFGKGVKTTLTAFLVSGTAPGTVTSSVKPISNVITETFWINK